jgi:hypothetical protein
MNSPNLIASACKFQMLKKLLALIIILMNSSRILYSLSEPGAMR